MIKATRKKTKGVKLYLKTKMTKIPQKVNNKNPLNKFLFKQKRLKINQNKNKEKKVVNSKNSKLNNRGKVPKIKI